jgi:hypothetical protein
MARKILALVTAGLVASSIDSPADAFILPYLRRFLPSRQEFLASECMEQIVADMKGDNDCADVSLQSWSLASKGALNCFKLMNAKEWDEVREASASLEVVRLTLQKFCCMETSAQATHNVNAASTDLRHFGQTVRELVKKMTATFSTLQLRHGKQVRMQQHLKTALHDAIASQEKNARLVSKLLQHAERDFQLIGKSRRAAQRASENIIHQIGAQRQSVHVTRTKFNSSNIYVLLPNEEHHNIFIHTFLALAGLCFAWANRKRILYECIGTLQGLIFLVDFAWTLGFVKPIPAEIMSVTPFRCAGLLCFLAQLTGCCLHFAAKRCRRSATHSKPLVENSPSFDDDDK